MQTALTTRSGIEMNCGTAAFGPIWPAGIQRTTVDWDDTAGPLSAASVGCTNSDDCAFAMKSEMIFTMHSLNLDVFAFA
jgi:hypothetical protein